MEVFMLRAMDTKLLNVPPSQSLPGTDVVMPFMLFAADEAFLLTHLMKPYPFTHLDHVQSVYNYKLSKARCVVGNAFGILVNRWQVFLTTVPLDPEAVFWITLAALSLHHYLRVQATDTYTPPVYI